MKQWISPLLSGLSCLLALACLVRLSNLKQQQQELKNQLLAEEQLTRNQILSDISTLNSADSSLDSSDSLLSASSFSIESYDLQSQTAQLRCVLTPKEFSPQETTATLCINGQDQPLTLRGSSFSLTLPVPLFQETTISALSFSRGGSVRTQALDWRSNPRDLLPKAYVFLSGQSSTQGSRIHYKGDLHISVEQEGGLDCAVEDIDLVEVLNGQELTRVGLLNKKLENTVYWGSKEQLSISGQDPLTATYRLEGDYPSPEGLSLQAGDLFQLVVEIQDSNGLVHRCVVDELHLNAANQLEGNFDAFNQAGDLYLDGQLIYAEPQPEIVH